MALRLSPPLFFGLITDGFAVCLKSPNAGLHMNRRPKVPQPPRMSEIPSKPAPPRRYRRYAYGFIYFREESPLMTGIVMV